MLNIGEHLVITDNKKHPHFKCYMFILSKLHDLIYEEVTFKPLLHINIFDIDYFHRNYYKFYCDILHSFFLNLIKINLLNNINKYFNMV